MNKKYIIPQIIYKNINPTVNDDITDGYIKGQPWFNVTSKEYFLCSDNLQNNAVWKKINLDNSNKEVRYGHAKFLGNDLPNIIEHGLTKTPTFISVFPNFSLPKLLRLLYFIINPQFSSRYDDILLYSLK